MGCDRHFHRGRKLLLLFSNRSRPMGLAMPDDSGRKGRGSMVGQAVGF